MHTLRRSRSSASQCPVPLVKKIVIFGDANSGKTYLLHRLHHDEYPNTSLPLVNYNDTYEKFEDSYRVRLMLVDTNSYYDRLFSLFCVATDLLIMCFAIDAPDSLDKIVSYWKPEVIDKYCKNVPIVLLGTKVDLRRDTQDGQSGIVTREEALRVAETIGAMSYRECSAKLGDGVREVFDAAVKHIVHNDKTLKNDRRKSKCLIS